MFRGSATIAGLCFLHVGNGTGISTSGRCPNRRGTVQNEKWCVLFETFSLVALGSSLRSDAGHGRLGPRARAAGAGLWLQDRRANESGEGRTSTGRHGMSLPD